MMMMKMMMIIIIIIKHIVNLIAETIFLEETVKGLRMLRKRRTTVSEEEMGTKRVWAPDEEVGRLDFHELNWRITPLTKVF